MKNFLKNIAFVVVLAIIAFTSAFAMTSSPPGNTNSISSVQTRFIVQPASPLISVSTVQDSVLNDTGAFSFNETLKSNSDLTAKRHTEFYDAINFNPSDSSRIAFAPNINAGSPNRFIKQTIFADKYRRPIQRE